MSRRPYLRPTSTWWHFWRWGYAGWGVKVGGVVAPCYRLGPLLFGLRFVAAVTDRSSYERYRLWLRYTGAKR